MDRLVISERRPFRHRWFGGHQRDSGERRSLRRRPAWSPRPSAPRYKGRIWNSTQQW